MTKFLDSGRRVKELPAVEWSNGDKEWWVTGKLHREGGLPAIECVNGTKGWYVNGKRHRDGDLPAIECGDGGKAWYFNGQCHRAGGLPAVEYADGTKKWYVNGQCHRDGGLPALEWSGGRREWWINNKSLTYEKGLAYFSFCQKMKEKNRVRAQKKIYFWWIQICYDLNHPSGCGQRMENLNLISYQEMIK